MSAFLANQEKADIFFSIISGLIALSCILPFIFVIIISVTDEKSILQYGYSFSLRSSV